MIEQGQQAPDFELSDHGGDPVRLSGLRGPRVVVLPSPEADEEDL